MFDMPQNQTKTKTNQKETKKKTLKDRKNI